MGSEEVNKRDPYNCAKSELKNYRFLRKVCRGFEDKILRYETSLAGVRSPSDYVRVEEPVYIIGSPQEFVEKEYRRADLVDKLQVVKEQYLPFKARLEAIVEFLDFLEYEDRKIITEVYINGKRIEDKAVEVFVSDKTLKRRIDEILDDFLPFR